MPFQQGPFVVEFLHGRGFRAEFLAPVRRLDVIEIAEVAVGIEQQGGQAHIDQIIRQRADAFAVDQGGMNKPARRHRRRRLDLVVKPAPMLAAQRRDLVGGKADEASASHGGLDLQGMRAAMGDAFLDADVAGLGEAGRNGAGGGRFEIVRYNDAGREWPALASVQPDTTIPSTIAAAANEIFMESPRSPLSDEPIGSP